jgi:ABC-2 type transport system ATP-binding protein
MYTLEANNIYKKYGTHQALHDVSITVPEKTVFGLLGPNGAGKTSLIRIINQITGPDEGTVLFKGKKLGPGDVEHIGYLPEERGLYKKMKVGEQCMYLARLKGLSSRDAKIRLHDWFTRFDIMSWWDKKIEDLSKGMAQKIQFITTVLHNPDLLILDEPFSGFDPINAELIRNEMLRMKSEGTTIILSTHDMGSVEELCDHITLINRAKVILNGSVRDVKNQFRKKIFEVVFSGYPMDLSIGMGHNFELIKVDHEDDYKVAQIRLLNNKSLNDLLVSIIPGVEIVAVKELIPGMDEIFIEAVNSFNSTHG